MIKYQKNLYWSETHRLNLKDLTDSCTAVVNYAENNLKNPSLSVDIPLIGDTYNSYNLLLFPLPEIHNLYRSIQSTFKQIRSEPNWWIKCWANVYTNQAHYDWHQHNTHYRGNVPMYPSYHGIFCVQGIDSATTYRNSTTAEQVHIYQQPNQLSIIQNHPDWSHRTWPYKHPETRVTVAFNIVHLEDIDPFQYVNHWVPL